MINQGKTLLTAVNQIRDYFEKISLLLLTADSQMDEHGWKPAQGSTSNAYGSAAIYLPRQWLPYDVFRFYKHVDFKHFLLCISIILDNKGEKNEITEPLISAAIFDYKPKTEIGHWDYGFARWHLAAPNRLDNGEIIEFDPTAGLQENDRYSVNSIHSLALPLTLINDSNALNERIIQSILQRVFLIPS